MSQCLREVDGHVLINAVAPQYSERLNDHAADRPTPVIGMTARRSAQKQAKQAEVVCGAVVIGRHLRAKARATRAEQMLTAC